MIIKILYLIILIIINLSILFFLNLFPLILKHNLKAKFINEIQTNYNSFNKVNIDQIYNRIYKENEDMLEQKINSTIDIGFTLDINYIYETMLTVTSIMATQKKTTKIRFHFGVTNNFTAEKMVEIYELKNKINNNSKFNFYYLKDSVIKMKGFHPKGEACPGKFELPQLLSDDIEKLIIFDAGDLLVLRDLTELFEYNMGQYLILGIPEPSIINSFMKVKYNITKYINIGSILIDVKRFKQSNIWINYTKNRNITLKGQPDQTLINIIIPDSLKNYLPFKFGGICLFSNDENSDSLTFRQFLGYKNWINSSLSVSLPENPKSEKGILLQLYNPRFIHQFYGKWAKGLGLSIYRHLAKYFMLLSGITFHLCKRKPKYCW